MYLRHSTVTKCGKTHTYWRLVRSVRMGLNVRRETVAMLGELDVQGRAEARALTRALNGSAPATPDLFESESPEAPVPVKLSEISLERGRRFGDVWLRWTLWRALKPDEGAGQRMPDGREDVAWPLVSSILVLARLCEPSSELHIAEDWYRRTALEDLLGIPAEKINEQRLYRGLDELLPHKDALTTHLKERVSDLFGARYDLLLDDMTSTYFEGLAKSNRLAKRGHSRDHRPDCKQVCIALVVTQEGFPLGYGVFAGNTADAKTLQGSVRAVKKKLGKLNRIWVMDREMAGEKNVSFLRKGKRQYVVATPKAMLKKLDRELGEKGWTGAENAFRMLKSDLRLRPIWHQKTERVEAHILVCFLAYALYKTLEQWGWNSPGD